MTGAASMAVTVATDLARSLARGQSPLPSVGRVDDALRVLAQQGSGIGSVARRADLEQIIENLFTAARVAGLELDSRPGLEPFAGTEAALDEPTDYDSVDDIVTEAWVINQSEVRHRLLKGRVVEPRSIVFVDCRFVHCTFTSLDAQFIWCRLVNPTSAASSARGAVLRACEIEDAAFEGFDWSGAVLDATAFTRCVLKDASFRQGSLIQSRFHATDARGATFTESRLTGSVFDRSSSVADANFDGADLTGATLSGDWRGATLIRTDLTGCRFEEADMRGTHLQDVRLSGTTSSQTRWDGAVVSSPDIAEPLESALRAADARIEGL